LLAPRLFEAAGPFFFCRPHPRFGLTKENLMAKGQKRSNREIKKPKQKKPAAAAPAVLGKGRSAPTGNPKKTR
jgi:hypothetical protein